MNPVATRGQPPQQTPPQEAQRPPQNIKGRFNKTGIAQKGLLVATVTCAILSVIPPLRLAGALSLRAIACLASLVNVADAAKKGGIVGPLLACAKVAIVVLGIAALAAASPVLVVASLAADVALQIFEFIRAVHNKDVVRALCSLGIIVVDVLALSAVAAGSWQLMVAAASASAAGMLALGISISVKAAIDKKPIHAIDALCYVALSALGIYAASSIAEVVGTRLTTAYFKNKNDTPETTKSYYFDGYDDKGNRISHQWFGLDGYGHTASFRVRLEGETSIGLHANVATFDKKGEFISVESIYPYKWDAIPQVVQQPISVEALPTVPVGGTAIVTSKLR